MCSLKNVSAALTKSKRCLLGAGFQLAAQERRRVEDSHADAILATALIIGNAALHAVGVGVVAQNGDRGLEHLGLVGERQLSSGSRSTTRWPSSSVLI